MPENADPMSALREALVEAVLPLEVIAGQHRVTPYRELSPDFIDDINTAIGIVRDALSLHVHRWETWDIDDNGYHHSKVVCPDHNPPILRSAPETGPDAEVCSDPDPAHPGAVCEYVPGHGGKHGNRHYLWHNDHPWLRAPSLEGARHPEAGETDLRARIEAAWPRNDVGRYLPLWHPDELALALAAPVGKVPGLPDNDEMRRVDG